MHKLQAEAIACGEAHSLALCDNASRIVAWGDNSQGQLGAGDMAVSARPIPTTLKFATAIKQIACGSAFSMALTDAGAVYTWGHNADGQLGLGDTDRRIVPTLVAALQGTFINAIAAGHFHCAAIQHGLIGDLAESKAGAAVGGPALSALSLGGGGSPSSAGSGLEHKVNRIFMWGANGDGQLGIGKDGRDRQLFPARMPFDYKWDRVDMALGRTHTLILGKDFYPEDIGKQIKDREMRVLKSTVYACGRGASGQLGLPADLQEKHTMPKPIPPQQWVSSHRFLVKTAEAKGDRAEGKEKKEATYPHFPIRLIAAGESSSMAVEYQEGMEVLWAWGLHPGLFDTHKLRPWEVLQFVPQDRLPPACPVMSLLQPPELETKKPIYKLHYLQLACAKSHFMVLFDYNNEAGAANKSMNVVFSWGDARYGKLGHGSIPEYQKHRADRLKPKCNN